MTEDYENIEDLMKQLEANDTPQIAREIGAYYAELLRRGVPEEEAFHLTREYQTLTLNNGLQKYVIDRRFPKGD